MVTLAGYKNLIPIHNSINSKVYRGRRVDDYKPVILKFLNQDYPTTEQIRRYKQEYYLTCQLKSPGIIKAYSLVEWQRSFAIIFEDFGGISLQELLKEQKKLSLEEFLFLAIAITESLGQIHTAHIIHKDINPANIIFNRETKELKIIDFGISTQLSRENPTLKNPNILEGTLAYISPEQTGRMNRSLDYRSDFYSLGITFYEFLTGKLPFTTEDALELVHSHLAKEAISPSEIDGSIPQVISEIVMKLMTKNAENRYQSAYGLKADLENCRQQLESLGNIEVFPLANQDFSERFQIPQKLYGRETEIATLLAAFERVAESGKVELMMVAGYSGIGKSSLVQELFKPITARRGYFISGKFDQFQKNIPYSAIVSAFGGLIRQLLGETEAKLQQWREKLLKALGSNGQVIIDVIPEVELIIGKQPPVPVLGANEAQNRFNLIIGNFIHAFCSKKHPLTLFIDDLQWADLGSIQLIEQMLIEEQTEYFLLLGAYRDNEVSASHPWGISLEKLRQNNEAFNQITLNPLPIEEIAYLISDTLGKTPETVSDLAQLVKQKTGGNPFFVNEFLQALYDEKLLQFNRKSRIWQWNIEAIAGRNFTDNVVELMMEKLQQLPKSSQEILSLAACLGAEFDLSVLTWIEKKTPPEIFELLKIPLDLGFIFPLSELDENLLFESYKFGHDRIQQAAYSLIPEKWKQATHLNIGQCFLEQTSPEEQEEMIFTIVGQLNQGCDLLTAQTDRHHLALLNLQAGRKAKISTAYRSGVDYLQLARQLLAPDSWESEYQKTLEIFVEALELEYLITNFHNVESLAEIIFEHTQNILDRIKVYEVKIQASIGRGDQYNALEIGLNVLKMLDISLLESQPDAISDIAGLIDAPEMSNPYQLAAMNIMAYIITPAWAVSPDYLEKITFTMVDLSLKYGNCSYSAFGYVWYGTLLGDNLGDIDGGYEFGQLSLALLDRFDARELRSKILLLYASCIGFRKEHVNSVLSVHLDALQSGLETGDMEFASYAAAEYSQYSFLIGVPLETVRKEFQQKLSIIEELKQNFHAEYLAPWLQSTLNLLGESDNPTTLSGPVYNESDRLQHVVEEKQLTLVFVAYFVKSFLCYMFEDCFAAVEYGQMARKHHAGVAGTFFIPTEMFYSSLARIACLNTMEKFQQHREQEDIDQCLAKLKYWAKYAPMNYQHKCDLIEAELAKQEERFMIAMKLYDSAIAAAKENEYIQEEALANELAAKFYLNWGHEKVARVYMTDAHYCYSIWGGTAKVKQLEKNYPQLLYSPTTTSSGNRIFNTRATSSSKGGIELDLATVIKSTNAISSEIVLENLLATLMDILVENAGARRGILILPRGERLFVEATKEEDLETVAVLQSVPLDKFEKLSEKIVRYVARTRKTVVLNNASTKGNFTDDAYIQQYQCQSIACTPLINQNKFQGIIYLENNLSTGAFTQERLALLRTLAAQGAISLENARLYDAYKRFVPEQFLSLLEKKSIVDVELGEQVEREMTVMFSDIRGFTTISEQMTPGDNFAFINEYLGYMEPQIQKHGGFIDKYIGDAIMALFPNSADDAVKGAIAMLEELKTYNLYRRQKNLNLLRIGIGLHTGKLILGTVGGFGRMDGTVIGDAVNLSSRVEGLTKKYGVSLLITHQTLARLKNPAEYDLRFIEKVKAQGKAKAVGLFEVFSADPPELRDAKIATKEKFQRAVLLYHHNSFVAAGRLFQECVAQSCGDRPASSYLERCQGYLGNRE